MSCECEELRAQLDRLRAKAGWVLVRERLGLTETPARLVARMARAPLGVWVPGHDLELELAGGRMLDENVIRVHVNRLREALGRDYVESKRLVGYRLSEAAWAELNRILEGA